MNKDPVLETLQAAAAGGNAQRIVPEHHRYRWEQQWLRENRAVSDVVDNGSGHATALAQTFQAASHGAASQQRADVSVQFTAANPLSAAAAIGAGPAGNETDSITARPAVNGVVPSPALPWPLPTSAALDSPDTAPVTAATLAARHRSALRQFAMWRTDDEVKVALRVDESATTDTLDALRQWLKDLRLKLTSLTVNGSVRWQSRPKNSDGRY